MKSRQELHVLISFDMESDIGSWTSEHRGVAEGTPRILDVLDRDGINCTFFFTGDAALSCPDALEMVKSAGHEIGCHTLHHESLGPPLFDAPGIPPVLPEEIPNRLTKATDLVQRLAGVRPVSFRAPRGWASSEMLVTLDALGYIVDSSYMIYYFDEHLLPYHPRADDWTQEGDLSILEVPLFADVTVHSTDPYRRDRDQWPKLRTEGAEHLAAAILAVSDRMWSKGKPALACLYLHPWEFVEMPSVVETCEARIEFAGFLWQNTGARALAELGDLVTRLRHAGAQFHSMRDFHELWTAKV
jgi:peptidoglycan/xylan/chitin deacetylase (PgdA/CDA1 family)